MLTQSLAALLEGESDLQVVGQLSSGAALLAWLPVPPTPAPADVLLLDLHLPPPDGLTLLPQLRQHWPSLRVLVFSTLATPEIMTIVEQAGAWGFVPKSADASQLLDVIRTLCAGKKSFPKLLRPAPITPSSDPTNLLKLHRLSVREREIVRLICEGLTTRDMADQLSLSEFTVGTHRRNILHKLELHNVAALTQFARDHGL